MRLLAATDFALRVLMVLRRQPAGRPLSVEMLARELGGLSRHHLHKIVQELTALGVTRTTRGIAGGVALAVDPATLQLGTLMRRLESRQPLVECFRGQGCTCTLVSECGLKGMLRQAEDRFYAALDEHTLAECVPSEGVTHAPPTRGG